MKKRLFFIIFMTLFCSTMFGQQHWTPTGDDGTYSSNFTIDAVIQFDGVEAKSGDLELGVFYGDECRASAKTVNFGTGHYVAEVIVFGEAGQFYTLKLYDHSTGQIFSDNYVLKYDGGVIDDLIIPFIDDYSYGTMFNPATINFKTPNYYTPDTYGDNDNISITAVVLIDGVEQYDSNLELGAFCGNVVKGSAKTNFVDTNNGVTRNYARMTVSGKSNDVITFRLYNHSTGKELEFTEVNTINFVANNSVGTILQPLEVNFITASYVAKINDVNYISLDAAIAAVQADETITMLADDTLTETLTIAAEKNFTLDLNGKKITYTSTTQGEAMITNRGNLTINDSGNTGEIYYNYTGAADPTYRKGNYTISNGGTLTVNGGKIHIAKLSQHAKYPIDNNSTSGDAILVINGGHLYNYNTSAIRQFCNSTTNKNSVTINGGLIEGYSAIWMQNPGSKTVNGQLAINAGEIKTTAKAYVEGTSSISEVASKIYCTTEGGTWDEESAFVITGGTINENVNLSNEAPASVKLMKEAAYNGNVEFELSDGAQLIHNGLEGVTINMNIEASSEGWGTLSSPTTEGKVVFSTTGTHDFYKYVESADWEWRNLRDSIVDNSYTMDNGRGYLYANTAGTEVSFTGTLNYQDVEFPLSYTDKDLAGFNFIGNPFTHNITAAHLSGNKAVGYYVVGEDSTFKVKNTTSEIIAPMQAILVQAIAENDTLTIQKAAPATQTREASNGALEIVVANANYSDVAYVSFNDDIGLEKIGHQNANAPLVYVTAENKKFAIATMKQDVNEIPVSFVAKTMGQYTISVEAVDCEFNEMYLTDRMTGEKVNLLLEDYTFVATSNDNADRFVISFATTKPESVAENFIYINNSNMIINNIEGNAVVRVLDVLGRPVAEYNVTESANISTATLSSGVYMIQMYDNNGVKVQKIVVE